MPHSLGRSGDLDELEIDEFDLDIRIGELADLPRPQRLNPWAAQTDPVCLPTGGRGAGGTCNTNDPTCQATCAGLDTCPDTCQGTCDQTCPATCPDTCAHTCAGTCQATCGRQRTCGNTCAGTCVADSCPARKCATFERQHTCQC